jgi:hypothetical protein
MSYSMLTQTMPCLPSSSANLSPSRSSALSIKISAPSTTSQPSSNSLRRGSPPCVLLPWYPHVGGPAWPSRPGSQGSWPCRKLLAWGRGQKGAQASRAQQQCQNVAATPASQCDIGGTGPLAFLVTTGQLPGSTLWHDTTNSSPVVRFETWGCSHLYTSARVVGPAPGRSWSLKTSRLHGFKQGPGGHNRGEHSSSKAGQV